MTRCAHEAEGMPPFTWRRPRDGRSHAVLEGPRFPFPSGGSPMSESLIREMFATIDARDWSTSIATSPPTSSLSAPDTRRSAACRPCATSTSGPASSPPAPTISGRSSPTPIGRPAGGASPDRVAMGRCSTSALRTSTGSSTAGSLRAPHTSFARRSDRPWPGRGAGASRLRGTHCGRENPVARR